MAEYSPGIPNTPTDRLNRRGKRKQGWLCTKNCFRIFEILTRFMHFYFPAILSGQTDPL